MAITTGRGVGAVLAGAALALLLPAGPAQAQCNHGGGRPRGSISLLQQQLALQQYAMLTALQQKQTQEHLTQLVARLEKRKLDLQTALDKTTTELTGLLTMDGKLPKENLRKGTALRKKQRRLQTALRQTTTLLGRVQQAAGIQPKGITTSGPLSSGQGYSRR